MKKVFTKEWFIAAGVRALKTIAQTAVATVGTSVAFESIDWKLVLSASLLAGVLSLLTSIAGLPELKIQDVSNTSDVAIPESEENTEVTFTESEEEINDEQ